MGQTSNLLYLFIPLMFLFILIILLLFFFKPWRFLLSLFSPSSPRVILPLPDPDLETLLVSDEAVSVVVDVDVPSEVVEIGQTLKWRRQTISGGAYFSGSNDVGHSVDGNRFHEIGAARGGCCLTLEVIAGPANGYRHTVTNSSKLPLTLGRVSPSDLSLMDSEVSGKHAMINWNLNKNKWELIDMGSLNGTLLNQQAVHHPKSGSRQWGDPVDLANGDIITLGTSSKISVKIDSPMEHKLPFDVGMASDPMAVRRGGKKLPMEDVCYYQWPITSTDQFGLFGICDGHGGAAAAKSVSKILPEKVADLLSDPQRRDRVVVFQDASDVIKDAFYHTEANLNHHYEGCTSTALLVWIDDNENIFAQCGNVGDSACIISVDGNLIKMSEDHRVTSLTERERIKQIGEPIKDGETRLGGLNLARMLGDKFLKEQDARFSSEPFISQVVSIDRGSQTFALLASDGFWDVIGARKATQLIAQAIEKSSRDGDTSAEKIANYLLNEARKLRTKDNTSLIFLDFSKFGSSL